MKERKEMPYRSLKVNIPGKTILRYLDKDELNGKEKLKTGLLLRRFERAENIIRSARSFVDKVMLKHNVN